MKDSNNIIKFDANFDIFSTLDSTRNFELFLDTLLDYLQNKKNIKPLADWWSVNHDNVIFNDSSLVFAKFLSSIKLTWKPTAEAKTKKDEQHTKIQHKNKYKEIMDPFFKSLESSKKLISQAEDIYGFNFAVAFSYLFSPVKDEAYNLDVFRDYYQIFGSNDPLKYLADKIKPYLLIDTPSVSTEIAQKHNQHPAVSMSSDDGILIHSIAEIASRNAEINNQHWNVLRAIIDCHLDDSSNWKFREEILHTAIKSNHRIFEAFISHFRFCYAEELCQILELPFNHKPAMLDAPSLNVVILNNIKSDGFDTPPIEKLDTHSLTETLRLFYTNYTHYRRAYLDGANPIPGIQHWTILEVCTGFTFDEPYNDVDIIGVEYLPIIYELFGGDITVLWSLYLEWFDIGNIFFDGDLSSTPKKKELTTIRCIQALLYSLRDEHQYDAAAAFIAAVLFKITNMTEGSLEAYSGIYKLIDDVLLLPAQNTDPLHKAIAYATKTSKNNNHKLTHQRLEKYNFKHDSRWLGIIHSGENTTCEFKETLRWDIKENKKSKIIEGMVLKTICAFCNTDGGFLFVGISDDGSVVGLDRDAFTNNDKLQLHFQNMLKKLSGNYIGYIEPAIEAIRGIDVFVIECRRTRSPVYLDNKMFVRQGPSSKELTVPEAVAYSKEFSG